MADLVEAAKQELNRWLDETAQAEALESTGRWRVTATARSSALAAFKSLANEIERLGNILRDTREELSVANNTASQATRDKVFLRMRGFTESQMKQRAQEIEQHRGKPSWSWQSAQEQREAEQFNSNR